MKPFASLAISLLATAHVDAQVSAQKAKIPVLIVSGANNHDWRTTTPLLESMLEASGTFEADVTYEPQKDLADASKLARYKAIVLDYNGPRWGDAAEAAFTTAVNGGTGVVAIHAANNAFPGWKDYERMIGYLWRSGAASEPGTGHGQFHAFDVTLVDREHPITRGMFDLRAHPDELYHRLWRAPDTNHVVLASAWSSTESGGTGRAEPMITVGTFGAGRIFHTPLGHVWEGAEATRASYADRQFQQLVVRGAQWAATGDCSGFASTANLMSKEEHEAGWTLLFDGFTFNGWHAFHGTGAPKQGWRVESGALECLAQGGGGDLVTDREYGDFELEFDWRVGQKSNSGVIYRVSDQGEATYFSGPEYQVIDDAYFGDQPSPVQAAAALYALVPAENKVLRAVGDFNRGKVVVRGWQIEHWLNGVRVLSCDLASEDGRARIAASKFKDMPLFATFQRGRIALQDHGDGVAYKSIKLRELAP